MEGEWSLPYIDRPEQRPCPIPPPDPVATLAPPTINPVIARNATSKLHYLIPATNSKDGVCVGVASALLNRYPAPVLVGWKAKGDLSSKGNHIAKLRNMARYFHSLKDASDDDLVIVVDAFDILAQIPAEATIELYFRMMREANEHLAARHGLSVEEARRRGLYQSLLWGAEKGCFPPMFHEAQCWLVQDSYAPHNQWGPKATTGEEPWRFPKALNGGAVIGPLGDLREFIDATLHLIEETYDSDFQYRSSDQLYLARLYARQEYHRNIELVPADKPYPGVKDGQGRTLPKPRGNETDRTEYHVTVDFEYAFAQHHCYNERFMHKLKYDNWDHTATIKNDHLEEGQGFAPYRIQMPNYIYQSLARLWEDIASEDKPTNTALEWVRNLRMNTNVATRRIFAFYHSTCIKSTFVPGFHDYWFFPFIDTLLRTAKRENHARAPISAQPIDGRTWISPNQHPSAEATEKDPEAYGGVFTDYADEPYLTFRELCGDHWNNVFDIKEEKEEGKKKMPRAVSYEDYETEGHEPDFGSA